MTSAADGVAKFSVTTAAKATPTATTPTWATISSRRGSATSASAPAGIVSRNIGSVVATWTADTTSGFGLSPVISQLVDVSNIAMPTLEAEVAMRITRKAAFPNTPHRVCADAARSGSKVDRWPSGADSE